MFWKALFVFIDKARICDQLNIDYMLNVLIKKKTLWNTATFEFLVVVFTKQGERVGINTSHFWPPTKSLSWYDSF